MLCHLWMWPPHYEFPSQDHLRICCHHRTLWRSLVTILPSENSFHFLTSIFHSPYHYPYNDLQLIIFLRAWGSKGPPVLPESCSCSAVACPEQNWAVVPCVASWVSMLEVEKLGTYRKQSKVLKFLMSLIDQGIKGNQIGELLAGAQWHVALCIPTTFEIEAMMAFTITPCPGAKHLQLLQAVS